MIDLRRIDIRCSPVHRIARLGVAALVVATLGATGISGALAQQEDGIYGGDIGTTPVVTGEVAPAPSDTGTLVGDDIEVPEVTPSVLEVAPPVLDEVTQVLVPEVVDAEVGEDMLAPVNLSAIFGDDFPFGEDFPAIPAITVEGASDDAIGGDINVGGTAGGTAGGTITMGDGGEGSISIGDGGSVTSG